MSKMKVSGQSSESAMTVLGIPAATYICVLGPYSRRVTTPSVPVTEINNFLSHIEHIDDDGIWTIVYGTSGNWKSEQISRRNLELIPLKSERGLKLDTVCGQANAFWLMKPESGKIMFMVKAEK